MWEADFGRFGAYWDEKENPETVGLTVRGCDGFTTKLCIKYRLLLLNYHCKCPVRVCKLMFKATKGVCPFGGFYTLVKLTDGGLKRSKISPSPSGKTVRTSSALA